MRSYIKRKKIRIFLRWKRRRLKGSKKVEIVSLLPGRSIESFQRPHGPNNTYLSDNEPAPWEREGVRYIGIGNREAYKELLAVDPFTGPVGPNIASTLWETKKFYKFNLAQIAADFYTLEALSSMSYMNEMLPEPRIKTYNNRRQMWEFWNETNELPDVDTIDGIAVRATLMLESLSSVIAPVIEDCLHYSIYGELQYHPATAYLGDGHDELLISWYCLTKEVGREQTAAWAHEMFSQRCNIPHEKYRDGEYTTEYIEGNAWHCSFGGDKWANVAKLAHYRAMGRVGNMPMDDRQFLDRAFNLQHNTGSALNKVSWQGGNVFDRLNHVLEAHGTSDWSMLLNHTSPNVKFVALAYLAKLNGLRIESGLEEAKRTVWEPIPWITAKGASQAGICKTTGKKIHQTDYIYTHKKGASLAHAYMDKCFAHGIDPANFQEGNSK